MLQGVYVSLFAVLGRDPDTKFIVINVLQRDLEAALFLVEVGIAHLNAAFLPFQIEVLGGVGSCKVYHREKVRLKVSTGSQISVRAHALDAYRTCRHFL